MSVEEGERLAGGRDEISELYFGRLLGRLPVDGVVDAGGRLTNEGALPEPAPTIDDKQFGAVALKRCPESLEFVFSIDEPSLCHTPAFGCERIILAII